MKGPVSTNMRSGCPELPHIIPFNTLQEKNAPQPPHNAIGIRYLTIVMPDKDGLERVPECVRREGIIANETSEGIPVHAPSHIGIILNAARLSPLRSSGTPPRRTSRSRAPTWSST